MATQRSGPDLPHRPPRRRSAIRLITSWGLLVAFMAVMAACASSVGSAEGDPRQVIVDTDMGVDDVRALMLLVEHPDVEVVAISVTGTGLGRCPESAHNAIALLELLGAPQVPVGCGSTRPIEGFHTFPTDLRDDAVALDGMGLQPEQTDLPGAVAVMSETLAATEAPVTLLTLGPLTNVAALLAESGDLDKLDDVWIMGGAVNVGGNIISFENFEAEFNIWIDPVAADQVFRSGLPMTLIPLDATNDVPLTPGFRRALAATPDSVATGALEANLAAGGPLSGVYHWDDLAAATLIDEAMVSFETLDVAVDIDLDSPTAGQTIRSDDGAAMRVAVRADQGRFEQLFFETLTGEPVTTEGLWEPASVITFNGEACSYTGPDPLEADISAKVENTSDRPGLGVVFGTYAADATAADIQAMVDGGFSAPPVFFDVHTLASLPANTTSFIGAENIPSGTTIWCAVNGDVFELAGPKLRTP